jgi:hypothetical protein
VQEVTLAAQSSSRRELYHIMRPGTTFYVYADLDLVVYCQRCESRISPGAVSPIWRPFHRRKQWLECIVYQICYHHVKAGWIEIRDYAVGIKWRLPDQYVAGYLGRRAIAWRKVFCCSSRASAGSSGTFVEKLSSLSVIQPDLFADSGQSHLDTGRRSGLTLSDSRHPAAEQLF